MATVYMPKRESNKKNPGRKKKIACYYIAYYDHQGKRVYVKGPSDYREALKLAAKLETEVLRRKTRYY